MKKFILSAVLAMFMFSCSESNDPEPITPEHPIYEEVDPGFGVPVPDNPIEEDNN
ncbi:hypothetical protein [Flammeovirga sp. EKP202]|uniref:hypothetical protein n=1 Tax=Flammeovirga sp. EKP202 TaxID=2770592 RepID=UPI00165ED0C2|nr:hypothetical protein [Flammeovirga sp. EKP202]MBD0400309.1 hypothetical protein [Flammeovirga sp. EKP202]